MRIGIVGQVHESLVDQVVAQVSDRTDHTVIAGRIVPEGWPIGYRRCDEPPVSCSFGKDVTYVPASTERFYFHGRSVPRSRIGFERGIFVEDSGHVPFNARRWFEWFGKFNLDDVAFIGSPGESRMYGELGLRGFSVNTRLGITPPYSPSTVSSGRYILTVPTVDENSLNNGHRTCPSFLAWDTDRELVLRESLHLKPPRKPFRFGRLFLHSS